MRCENAGSDYDSGSIQWTCRADVPNYFKLGATDVRCEGYKNSNDPYVLKGSCGVEYRLVLTERGEKKYGRRGSSSSAEYDFSAFDVYVHKAWKVLNRVFYVVFLGLVAWLALLVVRSILSSRNAPVRPATGAPPRRPPFDGWGGGGGGDDGGGNPPPGPPPPYTQYPPRNKPPTWQPWRPGFWTGLFGGGGAGYYAGHRAGQRAEQQRAAREERPRWFGSDHGDRRGRFGEGPSRQSPWASATYNGGSTYNGPARRYSSSSSSAGETHTTTGFGSTNNR